MASPPSVSAPADYSTPSFPFDATDAAAPTGYADGTLVEIRGENGLLLPATENPVPVVGGIYRIQGISSLVGTRGVVYTATAGYARAAVSVSASAGGAARAAVSVSGAVGGSARATMSQSASPAGYTRAALTATATLGGQADAAASDTTAPVVGTLTVTPGSGTACTFSATITDAVGVVKWLLREGASDPGAADPGQTGATTITSTTSKTFTSQAFTSTASATGTRYFRLDGWDAAGNHGVSAVASATVTIGGGATGVYGQCVFPTNGSTVGLIGLHANGDQITGYLLHVTSEDFGEGVVNTFSATRHGSPVITDTTWGGATYIRFEADDSGGGIRVRSGPSAAGPWTTVSSYTDPTPVSGGSTSSVNLAALSFTSGTY